MRLAVVASHPIQYQGPLFRELARRIDIEVLYAHRAIEKDQADAGFGVGFAWDVDLLSGYRHTFLANVAKRPGLDHFGGCDTPSIEDHFSGTKFDAVLVLGWHLKSFWQAIWHARRARIPVIVRGDSHLQTPRSLAKRAAKELVYPVALRAFDAALYVGQNSRRYWEHYRYPRNRLLFSPHCVDNDWFAARATAVAGAALRAAHAIAADATVLLFAGKLVPLKRPMDVVHAARILAAGSRPVTVLVAGAGPLATEMTNAARDAGIQLVHLGFCNQTEMPGAYAAADMLVLPSDGRETWGLVANEALASGIPIVVSDACGCAPDLAADGEAGIVAPVGDVVALAAAIGKLLDRPPDRSAVAARIARYSLGAAAQGIVDATTLVSRGSLA